MMAKPEASASGYKIGTVSKLTGISPDTLRVWERRYAAVTPQRSPGGGRLYTTEDISRLKLIRRLVDQGDTISVVAGLSHDELQARLSETRSVAAIAARTRNYMHNLSTTASQARHGSVVRPGYFFTGFNANRSWLKLHTTDS